VKSLQSLASSSPYTTLAAHLARYSSPGVPTGTSGKVYIPLPRYSLHRECDNVLGGLGIHSGSIGGHISGQDHYRPWDRRRGFCHTDIALNWRMTKLVERQWLRNFSLNFWACHGFWDQPWCHQSTR